jgi:dihydrofolate synthase / folylpolyglutamate synthase
MSSRPGSDLRVAAIRTSVFRQGDDLLSFMTAHLPKDRSIIRGSVIALTSKIVSLAENCVVPRSEVSKIDLVKRESDHFLGEVGHGVSLTIKHGLFIPSAGIDESNSESGDYITFPKDPFQSARRLHEGLKAHYGLGNEFGILITDSHTLPLRRGVVGIALSYWGFKPTRKLIGKEDLFGRKVQLTSVDVADALATAAVLVMGEVAEQSPLAIIPEASVEFTSETDPAEISIPATEDLYGPIYRHLLKS